MSKGFRYLDHTADVGIVAWGASTSETLTAATEGLLALMFEGSCVNAREERWIVSEGDEVDECVVNYFNELLFVVEGERWIPERLVEIRFLGHGIEARFVGEAYDPERHRFASLVKAATYHQFGLSETDEGCEVQIIFDV